MSVQAEEWLYQRYAEIRKLVKASFNTGGSD